MWKSSAPRTPRTLAREFVVVTLAVLIIWLIIGLVVYFSYGRYHSRLQQTPEPVAKV